MSPELNADRVLLAWNRSIICFASFHAQPIAVWSPANGKLNSSASALFAEIRDRWCFHISSRPTTAYGKLIAVHAIQPHNLLPSMHKLIAAPLRYSTQPMQKVSNNKNPKCPSPYIEFMAAFTLSIAISRGTAICTYYTLESTEPFRRMRWMCSITKIHCFMPVAVANILPSEAFKTVVSD